MSKFTTGFFLLLLVSTLTKIKSWRNVPSIVIKRPTLTNSFLSLKGNTHRLFSTTTDKEETTTTSKRTLLSRDRYVATNRFSVRKGKESKFEKRWATRKSKLASLEGFRYFHLMRRVSFSLDDSSSPSEYISGHDEGNSMGNYVSFTIWKTKKDFAAWRNGEAFKEAHGGTSIVSFVSTMINSAFVLDGPPRPAFYDGLLLQSVPPAYIPETEDGWRKVSHDFDSGVLPAECFVACNQFYIPTENGAAFEERWAGRSSTLKECDGFVSFSLLRRDGSAKGHGTVALDPSEPTYLSTTIWRDRAAFEAWKNGDAFKAAHGQKGGKEGGDAEVVPPPAPLWSKPPSPIFYEGALVISSEDGA